MDELHHTRCHDDRASSSAGCAGADGIPPKLVDKATNAWRRHALPAIFATSRCAEVGQLGHPLEDAQLLDQ
jgi:hypothetical protein